MKLGGMGVGDKEIKYKQTKQWEDIYFKRLNHSINLNREIHFIYIFYIFCSSVFSFQGLMIGIEMVDNLETKVPLNATHFVDIWENCKDMGVLLGKGGLNGNVSDPNA